MLKEIKDACKMHTLWGKSYEQDLKIALEWSCAFVIDDLLNKGDSDQACAVGAYEILVKWSL